MHVRSEWPVLHFGTPVVLVGTRNEDGSADLAPISSAWWLGRRAVLGIASTGHTAANLFRTGQCVWDLLSAEQVGAVDAIARTTGGPTRCRRASRPRVTAPCGTGSRRPGSPSSPPRSWTPRVARCPVQMETTLAGHRFSGLADGTVHPSRLAEIPERLYPAPAPADRDPR